MPRKKLDVSAAFNALSRRAALPHDDIVIIEPEPPKNKRSFVQGQRATPTTVEIELHNVHSLGFQSYGPGRCVVPVDVAAELLHQEQYAQAVDRRTFDNTQRFYQIVSLRSGNGGVVYRGLPVADLSMQTMLSNVMRFGSSIDF